MTTYLLAGTLDDLSMGTPITDQVIATPIFPRIPGIVGLGVTIDGIMVPDPVIVTANSSGEFVLMITATADTLAPSIDEEGIRYRVAIASNPDEEYVEFSMPREATTLHSELARQGRYGSLVANVSPGDLNSTNTPAPSSIARRSVDDPALWTWGSLPEISVLTQVEYDALAPPDPRTVYFITSTA